MDKRPIAPPKKKSQEDLARLLRDKGLRRTGPRIAVLDVLTQAKTPMSHGAVAEQLTSEGLDRATVYRNLMDLTEVGLVSRNDLGDHVWRFELRAADAGHNLLHPHLLCAKCGQVTCLDDVAVRFTEKTPRRALKDQKLELQLRGLCDACL
jgi:Fur family ferric uptake transcriptional regulator